MAEVMNSLFGVTPESLMAQREAALAQQAQNFAQLSPMQAAQAGFYTAGNRLAGAAGGLLGAQDPEMAKAAALQNILKGADTTSAEGLATLAKTLSSQGFGQQAMQAMDASRQAGLQTAQVGKTQEELNLIRTKAARDKAFTEQMAALPEDATDEQRLRIAMNSGSQDTVMKVIEMSANKKAAQEQALALFKERQAAEDRRLKERGEQRLDEQQRLFQQQQFMAGLTASLKGEKPLTEFQGKSLTFGTRAAEAHNILNGLEGTYNTLSANYLPSFANSSEGQKAKQAQDNFVNAVLRQESGAAINASEFENARKQYFPQPGDSQAVLDQKRQNRETVIKGFSRQAGPAGKDVVDALNAPSLKPLKTSFNTVAEAEAANLPKGTKITVGGKKAIVE